MTGHDRLAYIDLGYLLLSVNPLIATVNSRATDHHSHTVIGTLAVDG